MSGDGEGFLGRWSRLKRQVGPAPETGKPALQSDSPGGETEKADRPATVAGDPHDIPGLPDLPELPPIETITAGSDVSMFMHPGVPESVRQAALRRLWSVDPAIRDFISPAVDYAYDWNTPGGAPGWGALGSADDVVRMLGQVVDGFTRPESDEHPGPGRSGEPGEEQTCGELSQVAPASGGVQTPDPVSPAAVTLQPDSSKVEAASTSGAVRAAALNRDERAPSTRPSRRHGGALPH